MIGVGGVSWFAFLNPQVVKREFEKISAVSYTGHMSPIVINIPCCFCPH